MSLARKYRIVVAPGFPRMHHYKSLYGNTTNVQNSSKLEEKKSKNTTYNHNKKVCRFYYFSPLILYDRRSHRYIPIQTLIITRLRNVMLTVLKGACATCATMDAFSEKAKAEMGMKSRTEYTLSDR